MIAANSSTALAPSAMLPITSAKPMMRTSMPAPPAAGTVSMAPAHAALQLVCHLDGIDRAALGILVKHDGTHQGAGEVIGHQAPEDPRLADVVAHPRHVLRASG